MEVYTRHCLWILQNKNTFFYNNIIAWLYYFNEILMSTKININMVFYKDLPNSKVLKYYHHDK